MLFRVHLILHTENMIVMFPNEVTTSDLASYYARWKLSQGGDGEKAFL